MLWRPLVVMVAGSWLTHRHPVISFAALTWRLSCPSPLSLATVPRGEASGCVPCPFSNWTKSFFSVCNSGGGITYNLFYYSSVIESGLGFSACLPLTVHSSHPAQC